MMGFVNYYLHTYRQANRKNYIKINMNNSYAVHMHKSS